MTLIRKFSLVSAVALAGALMSGAVASAASEGTVSVSPGSVAVGGTVSVAVTCPKSGTATVEVHQTGPFTVLATKSVQAGPKKSTVAFTIPVSASVSHAHGASLKCAGSDSISSAQVKVVKAGSTVKPKPVGAPKTGGVETVVR